ncbi:MAG: 3-phosphoshikimate 1-carboxyvinyltransferase [Terriglobales bacterium]
MNFTLRAARTLSGVVRPPGDKSISHRYAILAALASGRSRLEHYSGGADCHSTLACLRALGVPITVAGETVEIDGVGLRGLTAPNQALDAGNSGSTIRMLSGVLAAQSFPSTITGDASLCRRPMRRVIEPLTQMGAHITASGEAPNGGRPPLVFSPVPGLQAISYRLPVPSAQVKSAVLLAGLYATGETVVEESLRSRDHTELALQNFGVPIHRQRGRITVQGPVTALAAQNFNIPGDASSAAFFLCAGALFPDADLELHDVLLNPTRATLLDVLRRMGAHVDVLAVEDRGGELVGTLRVHGPRQGTDGHQVFLGLGARPASAGAPETLQGTTIAGAETVSLIDEIPVLAVLATATQGGIEFRDAGELRVKESDRIASIARNLRAMGATCEERPDGLFVPGPQALHGAVIETFDDHRIAMAFTIAGLLASGETEIQNADCAAISFPDFYRIVEQIAR